MYVPKMFAVEEHETILRFMRENPFAIIVSEQEGNMVATHMPVEVEQFASGELVIRSHMAKQNPQWQSFENGKEILVIFNGPHAYISSSWYDHINVPTWNYIAIHAYGTAKVLDRDATMEVLTRIVERYEAASENPFTMNQLSEEYLESHLKALVAFEVVVQRLEAKEKLSQNRNAHNIDLITGQLEKSKHPDEQKIRQEMLRIHQKKIK